MGKDKRSRRDRRRKRSRSPPGRREKVEERNKPENKEKEKEKDVKEDLEEKKKAERQEAWKKAKMQFMKVSACFFAKDFSQTCSKDADMSPMNLSLPSSNTPSSDQAPASKNIFGQEEEESQKKTELKDLVDLKASAPAMESGASAMDLGEEEEEEEEVKDEQNKEEEKDEPDELDQFMSGIVAEHEKLLKKGGSSDKKERGGGAVVEQEDNQDMEKMMTKSDEELFLPIESKKKVLQAVDHSSINYGSFRKNFYHEVEEITKMTDEQVAELREKLDHIKVRGKNCPKPILKFTQAGLPDSVLNAMEKFGFVTPTPIQSQSLPAVMSGRDVIGIAKTGSGKTLAFVLPMLRHILDQPPIGDREGPIALILVPTRELCMQIRQEITRFKSSTGVSSVAVYGGSDVSGQIASLKRGCEVVVATPGRLIDILTINNGRITNFKRTTFLVLDEADRLFDMGFAPQITNIIENIRPNKQAVMFSATFPASVESLARKALRNPVEIVVGGRLQVCGDVDQKIMVLKEDQKFPYLLKALGDWYSKGQILIFADRQEAVDVLYRKLQEQGYTSMTLHGGKDQLDRISTISDFKSGLENILIATSVAARGLDVRNLVLVVNYDVPNHIEDYVHRVGRTGRAGRKGTAITFITEDEERYAPALMKALSEAGKTPPKKLKELAESYEKKVSTGEIQQHRNDGYKTKGYSFTEEERKEKRKQEMLLYGIETPASDDEEENSEDGDGEEDFALSSQDKLLKALEKDDVVKKVASVTPNSSVLSSDLLKLAGVLPKEKLDAAEAAKQQLLLNQQQQAIGGGIRRAADIAKALALKSAREVEMEKGINNEEEEDSIQYQAEIEINDFSQNVRHKISKYDTIQSILELYPGVAIIVKGTYVQPGRKPLAGERKLYIEVLGFSEINVKLAKKEIIRILKESTQDFAGVAAGRERYAKYSVL